MKYVTRYDINSNAWITGYYKGFRFYVVSKSAA